MFAAHEEDAMRFIAVSALAFAIAMPAFAQSYAPPPKPKDRS